MRKVISTTIGKSERACFTIMILFFKNLNDIDEEFENCCKFKKRVKFLKLLLYFPLFRFRNYRRDFL